MQLPDRRRYYSFAYGLGIALFLVCHLYDLFFHWQLRWELLGVRLCISLCFVSGIVLFYRIPAKWLDALATLLVVMAGSAVTLLAVITGEGFASPVYAGLFIVFIASSLLFQIATRLYIMALAAILVIHFTALAFFPSPLRYIILQVLALSSCAGLGIVTHHIIYSLFVQTRKLEEILPICAKCKKIRDDKGYWNQVEEYIREHYQTEFTHSLCEHCAEALYGSLYRKCKTGISA